MFKKCALFCFLLAVLKRIILSGKLLKTVVTHVKETAGYLMLKTMRACGPSVIDDSQTIAFSIMDGDIAREREKEGFGQTTSVPQSGSRDRLFWASNAANHAEALWIETLFKTPLFFQCSVQKSLCISDRRG